jgi:hypothetical protein
MRDEMPRIVGLGELRQVREYDPWSVANKVAVQRNWLWRVFNWISGRADLAKTVIRLREQIINMETVRLGGLRESDQAGALGLQLYAENEVLRAQVEELTSLLKNPIKHEETIAFFRDGRDKAIREYEQLKRKYDNLWISYDKLITDWDVFATKFIDGDPDLADVFRKIDKLKEEK